VGMAHTSLKSNYSVKISMMNTVFNTCDNVVFLKSSTLSIPSPKHSTGSKAGWKLASNSINGIKLLKY